MKFSFLILLILLADICLFAQSHAIHDIDSVMDLSPNYLPTHYSPITLIEFEPLRFTPIDTGMFTTHLFDPLLKPENIYQDLSIRGQAHQSIIFDYEKEMGFLYQVLPFPLLFKKQSNLNFYKLKTTYTKAAYTISFPSTNNEIFAEFANYSKGITVVLNMYGTFNESSHLLHHHTRNLCGDILIHYELPSSKYGFRVSYIINNIDNQENGGLYENDKVRSTEALSNITTHDAAIQNYVNLKDKQNRYFGTFTHSFQVGQTTIRYRDKFPVIFPHYNAYFSTQATNDSTRILFAKNSFQWSNFSPFQEASAKNYFFHIAGGVLYDYAELKYQYTPFNALYLFARTHIRLFNVMDITGQVSYSLVSDYFNNDLSAKAGISWAINRKKDHCIGFNAHYHRDDPEYLMKYASTNNFRWVNSFQKQNTIQFKVYWNYDKYYISASYFYLNNLVYLSEELRPVQNESVGHLVQLSAFIPFSYENFGATANLNVQYCTKEVVNVPLFAGKLSVFYVFDFFQKRLKIQIGTDAMYNTLFYADAYLPILRTFYYQNTQSVGNFIYWDANVTFKIDRINFFFRAGNILSPILTNGNFTTPDYPNNYLLSLGISWRFHD
jgi:hypothetical protein